VRSFFCDVKPALVPGFFFGFFHAQVRACLRTGADEDETRRGFRYRCVSDDLHSGAGSSGRLSRGPRKGNLFDLAEGRAQDERRGDRDASLRPGDVLLWRQYQKAGRAHLSLAVTEKQVAEVEEPGDPSTHRLTSLKRVSLRRRQDRLRALRPGRAICAVGLLLCGFHHDREARLDLLSGQITLGPF
jgi:hypothetical protein